MASYNRREFYRLITLGSLGVLSLRLTGCGPSQSNSRTYSSDEPEQSQTPYTIVVYDLMMYGYSNFSGDRLGKTGVLKATTIRDGQSVTLPYTQDGDGHKFTLTATEFDALKAGKKVAVDTTVNNGHNHKVVIDPAIKAPNAQSVEITDPTGQTNESIFVTIEEQDEPHLYMQGSQQLDPTSAEYCLAPKLACDQDATLWQKTAIHQDDASRQVLVSEKGLVLNSNQTEIPLMVRGRTKADNKLIEMVLKLMKK